MRAFPNLESARRRLCERNLEAKAIVVRYGMCLITCEREANLCVLWEHKAWIEVLSEKLMSGKCLPNTFMTRATCWNDKFLEQPLKMLKTLTQSRNFGASSLALHVSPGNFFKCHLKLTFIVSWHFWNFVGSFLETHVHNFSKYLFRFGVSCVRSLKIYSEECNFACFFKHVGFQEVCVIDKTYKTLQSTNRNSL